MHYIGKFSLLGILVGVLLTFTGGIHAQDTTTVTNPAVLYSSTAPFTGLKEIQLLDAVTGENTVIASLESNMGGAGWTHDGRYVWLTDEINGQPLFWLYDTLEKTNIPISDDVVLSECDNLIEVSPYGPYLVYREQSIGAIMLNTETLQPANEIHQFGNIIWSPVGNRFLYEISGYYILYDLDEDIELGRFPFEAYDHVFYFSNDGNYIAFRQSSEGGIGIYDVAAGSLDVAEGNHVFFWMPDNHTLLLSSNDGYLYYDVETGESTLINKKSPASYVRWSEQLDEVLFFGYERTKSSIFMVLPSGNEVTIFEVSGRFNLLESGTGWLAIPYLDAVESDSPYMLNLYLTDDITTRDENVIVDVSYNSKTNTNPITWSGNGRWLSVKEETGIYLFDVVSTTYERLPVVVAWLPVNNPFWSPDSNYLAILAEDEESKTGASMALWEAETDEMTQFPFEASQIIGWRNGDISDLLNINCVG